ncbi:putative purine-nucleoside phosphorylase [Listeria monocytogenes]|uniref:purine-nucleoside phosphorylase n=1 Tax=Listeria monocytogenes TaxID=1639 RepID=UPI000A1D445E|nr:purine-nucleoside phosphorylase [Listeria monocytogenes]ARM74502.1 putative purine-nucleoside phosphorylase [Listeria monocytogenes]
MKEAILFLKEQGIKKLDFGLVLGSGLGELADEIEDARYFDYPTIPGFPVSTVEGHKGRLVYGQLMGKWVLGMQGRFHFYEGYTMNEVTMPIRLMKQLGAHSVILTNAAGGVNEQFEQGELMMISDQINFTGTNPLIGPNSDEGPRFPDMSAAYDKAYQKHLRSIAVRLQMNLQEGIYMGFSGPSYETPAEIRMARLMGADAVGMSTVSETIVASHCGLRIAGISCITNLAAGMQATLNHEEVVDTTEKVKEDFKTLIKTFIQEEPHT